MRCYHSQFAVAKSGISRGLEPWKRIQDPTNSIFTKYESGTNKLVTFVTFSDTII